METWFWAGAVLFGGLVLGGRARMARRRRRSSIGGMLDGSRPCAVRTRG